MLNTRRNARDRKLLRRCAFKSHYSSPAADFSGCSAHSTLTNKSRLKLLHLREQHLQDLFQASRDQLVSLSSSSQYVQFLQGVIVQGFLQLLEPEVTIHARETDVNAAKQAAEGAANEYKEISGREIKYDVVSSLSNDL
jgi:V-type H+-transporting ATPase subunit E